MMNPFRPRTPSETTPSLRLFRRRDLAADAALTISRTTLALFPAVVIGAMVGAAALVTAAAGLVMAGIAVKLRKDWRGEREAIANTHLIENRDLAAGDVLKPLRAVAKLSHVNVFPSFETYAAMASGKDPVNQIVLVNPRVTDTLNADEMRMIVGHEYGHLHFNETRRPLLMAATCVSVCTLAGAVPLALATLPVLFALPAVAGMLGYGAIMMSLAGAQNRHEEYMCDRFGAVASGSPDVFAAAHGKIIDDTIGPSYYPINPVQVAVDRVFKAVGYSSHPPKAKRIARLDALAKSNPAFFASRRAHFNTVAAPSTPAHPVSSACTAARTHAR